MHMVRRKSSPRLLVVAIAAALATPAVAAPVLEEIVVTAQKREQTLQEIPVAVSAFSGDFIAEANVTDIRGLVDLTPGFNGRTEDSFIDALAIRGIVTNDFGIGGDPSVSIFQEAEPRSSLSMLPGPRSLRTWAACSLTSPS